MSLYPDLLYWAPNHRHEFILINETGQGRYEKSENNSCDHNPQILEMIKKGLFLLRISFVPEFENFIEKKHATGFCIRGISVRTMENLPASELRQEKDELSRGCLLAVT